VRRGAWLVVLTVAQMIHDDPRRCLLEGENPGPPVWYRRRRL